MLERIGIGAFAIAFVLVGCQLESHKDLRNRTNFPKGQDAFEADKLETERALVLSSSDVLPTCTPTNEGGLYYLQREAEFRYCVSEVWKTINLIGEKGFNGLVSTSTLPPGHANCGTGGLRVITGIDLDRNQNLSDNEIAGESFLCNGDAGQTGATGAPGAGENGLSSLIDVANEQPGLNCEQGGLKVSTGLDANRNNSLDSPEVQQTKYICKTDEVAEPVGSTPPSFEMSSITAKYYSGSNLVATEQVDLMSINYAWSDFKNISSNSLKVVWTTTLTVKEGPMVIDAYLNYGWATGKIAIDGKEISGNSPYSITLTSGSHPVTVTYVNNWHTAEFLATFKSERQYTAAESQAAIKSVLRPDTEIIYLDTYESGSFDLSVKVQVPNTGKKKLLVLGSNSSIVWQLVGATKDNLVGVVYASQSPASIIQGLPPKVPSWQIRPAGKLGYDSNESAGKDEIIRLYGRGPAQVIRSYGPTNFSLL